MAEVTYYNQDSTLTPVEFAYLWQEMKLPEVKKQTLLHFDPEELYSFVHDSLDDTTQTDDETERAMLDPSLPIIRTREDLDVFIQKGWDDVQAGRVFSLEEMDNKLDALKAKYAAQV